MMFPPSKRQRTSTRARSPLSLARLSTTGREQKGRPLAQFIVPGAKPTCLAPPSSSLTRPRCMRRSLRAESDTACDPSSPGPRTAATYTGVAVSKRTAGPSFLVRQRWCHPPGIVFIWDELNQGLDMALARRDFPSEDPIARPAAVWSWGPTRPPGPTTQRPAPGTASCRGGAASQNK